MISHFHPNRSTVHRVPGVLKSARDCLSNTSHAALRELTCEYAHGVLTLHGKVRSYYEKQLAQEAVRRVDGIRQIINKVEVFPSADWPER